MVKSGIEWENFYFYYYKALIGYTWQSELPENSFFIIRSKVCQGTEVVFRVVFYGPGLLLVVHQVMLVNLGLDAEHHVPLLQRKEGHSSIN